MFDRLIKESNMENEKREETFKSRMNEIV